MKHQSHRKYSNCQSSPSFHGDYHRPWKSMARAGIPDKGNRVGSGGTVLSGASWPAPWVISGERPRSVHRNQRGSSIRSASASRGQKTTDVQRHRRCIHKPHCTTAPLFKDGSQVGNLSGAMSEETWQLLISTLQSVRDETFGDLSIYARTRSVGGTASNGFCTTADGARQSDGPYY